MKLLLIMLVVCFVAGSAIGEDAVSVETVTVIPGADDTVAIFNFNGDISVEGWDSNEVEVVYTITCDDQEEMEALDVLCDLSSGIACEVEYDNDWDDNHNGQVAFLVRVPQNLALKYGIENVNGNVVFSSAAGTASIEVVNGDIAVSDFEGKVVIDLVNGSVSTVSISEPDEINIVNGEITCIVNELKSDFTLSSINGGISVDLAADAVVEIETISGNVGISDSFNAAIRENIVGASACFGEGEYTIHISTVSGDIEITD